MKKQYNPFSEAKTIEEKQKVWNEIRQSVVTARQKKLPEKLRDFLNSREFLAIDRISVAIFGKGSRKALANFKNGKGYLSEDRIKLLAKELQRYGFSG